MLIVVLTGIGLTCSPQAQATVPMDAWLLAGRTCPATVSIKGRVGADKTQIERGRRFRVLGKNRADASHYLVVVEGAQPEQRWVATDCGTLVAEQSLGEDPHDDRPAPGAKERAAAQDSGQAASRPPEPWAAAPGAGSFVLALSWQPAFCEVNRRRAECRDQAAGRPDATRFSLHGLWPQPRDNSYCGVEDLLRSLDLEGDWTALPAPQLSPAARERLAALMPGIGSGLDRHEWIRHGTCYGTDAETYFSHALNLVDQVNASPVRDLFLTHRGRHLSSRQIRAAFDTAFGQGTGDRVRVVCVDGMISELRLSLKGEIGEGTGIAALMEAAPRLSPRCRGGRIDQAGFE